MSERTAEGFRRGFLVHPSNVKRTQSCGCSRGGVADMVQVTHGVNSNTFDVAGQTVGYIREQLEVVWGISQDAVSLIGGDQVDEAHVLKEGVELDFFRPGGRKGTGNDRDDYFVRSADVLLKLNEIIFRLTRLEDRIAQVIKDQAPPKEYYTVEEFSKLADLAPYTVREHCRLGRLRAEKGACGRGTTLEWRISHTELVRYRNHGLLPLRKN